MDHPTQEELKILNDQRYLIVKQQLSEKIITELAEIERTLHKELSSSSFDFPKGTFLRAGKISKGENYRSLPFFILDYPRLFTKEDVFAFRSMLWWGNEFSCTLHLAGMPLKAAGNRLVSRLKNEKDVFFCINDNPWEYHFEESNYMPVKNLSIKNMENHIASHDFMKISRKIPLDNWDEFGDFSLTTLRQFLTLLH